MYEPKHKTYIKQLSPFDSYNGPAYMNQINPIIAAINIILTHHPKAAEEFDAWNERFKTIGD